MGHLLTFRVAAVQGTPSIPQEAAATWATRQAKEVGITQVVLTPSDALFRAC